MLVMWLLGPPSSNTETQIKIRSFGKLMIHKKVVVVTVVEHNRDKNIGKNGTVVVVSVVEHVRDKINGENFTVVVVDIVEHVKDKITDENGNVVVVSVRECR